MLIQTFSALFEVCIVEHCPDLLPVTDLITEMKASATEVSTLSFVEQSTLTLVDTELEELCDKREDGRRGRMKQKQ